MKTPTVFKLLVPGFLLLFSTHLWAVSADHKAQEFIECVTHPHHGNSSLSTLIFTPKNSSYAPILALGLQDLRFAPDEYPKPNVIVTPVHETQIRTIILCAKKVGIEIRVRCGGHDFEGISYTARVPFVMIDMINHRSVDVDVRTRTAWIQGGANLGETYYRIAEKSDTLGFPGGVWATVGSGGYISGGGYGSLKRKYGLGADNVIDARFMDVNGNILDKNSMGEDLFWAIRGGLASNFGVLLAWKVKVVRVPEIVTVFAVSRTVDQNAAEILYKWQSFAPYADRDLYLRIQIFSFNNTEGKKSVRVSFESLFQGRARRLLSLMEEEFPELGLTREDCHEVSYIQSALYFAGDASFSLGTDVGILLNRSAIPKSAYKAKSDYVREPIPLKVIEEIFERYYELDAGAPTILMTPYGGKVAQYPEDATPFPHRAGVLYMMYEGVTLETDTTEAATATNEARLSWLRKLHSFLAPYVSQNPREHYINYNDLDIGVGSSTYEEASIWGKSYWKNNFDRLIKVKTKVDPHNFFRHQQSIPPLTSFKDYS